MSVNFKCKKSSKQDYPTALIKLRMFIPGRQMTISSDPARAHRRQLSCAVAQCTSRTSSHKRQLSCPARALLNLAQKRNNSCAAQEDLREAGMNLTLTVVALVAGFISVTGDVMVITWFEKIYNYANICFTLKKRVNNAFLAHKNNKMFTKYS